MKIDGTHYRTIWQSKDDPKVVQVIDQRKLPFEFVIEDMRTVDDVARIIRDMYVRGAGLIGATAGWGMYLAALEAQGTDDFIAHFKASGERLKATRPTAVNLAWAVDQQVTAVASCSPDEAIETTRALAQDIEDGDAEMCQSLGQHGRPIIEQIAAGKSDGEPVNILTHCNAGWLAFVDHGSATAPIYAAHDAGIPVHVWVDETRPRNQGARLTAWELKQHGVPHTVIVDNAGGQLMRDGRIDMVLTGTDRTTRGGDVANKIGTYLKALAANDNDIPFYVALPSSTFDWDLVDGMDIPIEERSGEEVTHMDGILEGGDGSEQRFRIVSPGSSAANPAFDVTPNRLVTGLICERGVVDANEEAILAMFPEKRPEN